MVTLHDTRFVECRWWNDGWTVKTVVGLHDTGPMLFFFFFFFFFFKGGRLRYFLTVRVFVLSPFLPTPSLCPFSPSSLPRPSPFLPPACLFLFVCHQETASLSRMPREWKIPGSNPACAGIFSGSSHTSDLKIGTPVATLPGAWRYRVIAGTGRPDVSIV